MIQSDLIAKRPKTTGPNPGRTSRARISELATVIREKAETSKVPLMLIPRAPQCIGKSFLFRELSESFDHCSADNYMPEKFNPFLSKITPNVPRCFQMLSKTGEMLLH